MMVVPHLDRKLLLEAPHRMSDGAGGYTTEWLVLGTHWAAMMSARGKAARGEAGPLSRVPMQIIIRAYPVGSEARPEPGQRFVENTRIFAISSVTECDDNPRFLQVSAEEEMAV